MILHPIISLLDFQTPLKDIFQKLGAVLLNAVKLKNKKAREKYMRCIAP